jgi:hypothetical protein
MGKKRQQRRGKKHAVRNSRTRRTKKAYMDEASSSDEPAQGGPEPLKRLPGRRYRGDAF